METPVALPKHACGPVRDELVPVEPGIGLFCRLVGDGDAPVVIPHAAYLMDQFLPLAEGRQAVFLDWRNRGYSDVVSEPQRLANGIHHDVADLDQVRRHFGFARISMVTHSYSALSAILYAAENPECVERLVLIGPPGPDAEKIYPPELSCNDEVAVAFRESYAQLHSRRESMEAIQYCREAWKFMRILYVAEPRDADRLGWETCLIPNERGFRTHWVTNLLPSIRALQFSEDTMSKLQVPVLIIHGKKDRSAPYGAGCEWAARLPDARLVTVSGAAHVPWVEAPELVFGSIGTFLRGQWPEAAQRVSRFDRGGSATT